jgi:hypothetical protein
MLVVCVSYGRIRGAEVDSSLSIGGQLMEVLQPCCASHFEALKHRRVADKARLTMIFPAILA